MPRRSKLTQQLHALSLLIKIRTYFMVFFDYQYCLRESIDCGKCFCYLQAYILSCRIYVGQWNVCMKVASLTRLTLLSSLLSSKSLTLIRAICQTIDPYPIYIQSQQHIKNIGKTFPLTSSTTHLNIPQFQPLPGC